MDTVICTCGASLLGWINRQGINDPGQLAAVLGKAEDRERGAEICSMRALEQAVLTPGDTELVLLCSDTEDGARAGEVLRCFFARYYQGVELQRVEGLAHDDPGRFRSKGLRELVRLCTLKCDTARNRGRRPLINATGGYKAQVAFAALIGQALSVPVYYLFEAFSQIIELPPLPIALDMRLWIDHAPLLTAAREGLPEGDPLCRNLPPELEGLIERSEGQVITSFMGDLFRQMFASRTGRLELPPDHARPKPPVIISDGEAEIATIRGFMGFADRLLAVPYVTRVASRYHNPSLNTSCCFRCDREGRHDVVEGVYSRSGQTVKLDVFLTSDDPALTANALADLNARIDTLLG